VTSIGDETFYGCTSLKNVTIPSSVTSIGTYAFAECTSLEKVTIQNCTGIAFGIDDFNGPFAGDISACVDPVCTASGLPPCKNTTTPAPTPPAPTTPAPTTSDTTEPHTTAATTTPTPTTPAPTTPIDTTLVIKKEMTDNHILGVFHEKWQEYSFICFYYPETYLNGNVLNQLSRYNHHHEYRFYRYDNLTQYFSRNNIEDPAISYADTDKNHSLCSQRLGSEYESFINRTYASKIKPTKEESLMVWLFHYVMLH